MIRQDLRRNCGQALPEMVIVFPLVVILVMGIVQLALLYRGKATLNSATFLAARTGALNHGYINAMESAFFDRMAALGHIPEGLKGAGSTEGLFSNPNLINLAATQAAVKLAHSYSPIEVIWPTQAVFNHFAIQHRALEPCSGAGCPFSQVGGAFRLSNTQVFQIPIENQDARVQTLQDIDGSKVDLQDANLLSIKSRYCYELEVPVANFIIWRMIQVSQGGSADWQACQLLSPVFGENRFLIPMVGRSISRMQSGFRCENNETTGRNCDNL